MISMSYRSMPKLFNFSYIFDPCGVGWSEENLWTLKPFDDK